MTSLISATKQIPANSGYFITLTTTLRDYWLNNVGTDAAPNLSSGLFALSTAGAGASTLIASAGKILRDHGKTLVSAGRTFRKVQIVVPGTSSLVIGGTEGIAGSTYEAANATPYLTGYIELPGTGGASGGSGVAGSGGGFTAAPVARLG